MSIKGNGEKEKQEAVQRKKHQGHLLNQLSHQRSCNVNTYSEVLTPLGCTSERDICRVKRLLAPVGFPSCHPASNGTSGHLQHLTVMHVISLSLSSPVLAAPWGVAHQEHDRWEVPLTEMKYKMIPRKPSPQLMKAPCADSSCCRGKCRWDYYRQWFCLADGNPDLCCAQRQFVFLAAGKLESTKRHYKNDARPDPVSSSFAMRWLFPEGCSCQQLWHSFPLAPYGDSQHGAWWGLLPLDHSTTELGAGGLQAARFTDLCCSLVVQLTQLFFKLWIHLQ